MELIPLITEMRHWQKMYFKYRLPEHLKKAKESESKVDTYLKEQKEGKQTNLFKK